MGRMFLVLIALGAAMAWYLVTQGIACDERGGVLLRTVSGYECVKVQRAGR